MSTCSPQPTGLAMSEEKEAAEVMIELGAMVIACILQEMGRVKVEVIFQARGGTFPG